MNAIEFLKQNRVYEDETIYNSVGEIVGTLSQLMEEYATLSQPPVIGEFHCAIFDFRDKKCEQQCSDCHWMQTKSQ